MLTNSVPNKLISFFFYFIALQPILDILTTVSIIQLNTNATAGVLIRFLYMALCLLYLLLQSKQSSFARKAILYFAIWLIYLIVNVSINFTAKPTFNFFEEIKFFAKITYFNVILVHFIYLFKTLAQEFKPSRLFMRNIMISGIIIGLVMFISIMTGTTLNSYKNTITVKIGYSGWFYAGNEIGATISIIFPLIVYYAIMKTQNVKNLIYWIPVLLCGYSLIMLGTKVGYGALLLTLIVAFISLIIALLLKKKQFGNIKLNIGLTLLCIIAQILITPISPLVHNTQVHIDRNEKQMQEQLQVENSEAEFNNVLDLIFSGRQRFFAQHSEYFEQAPISQKLVGMGYGGNYTDTAKTIEIDYLDIFFSSGMIGTILYFVPIVYLACKSIFYLFKRKLQILLPKDALLILSIILGLGIAAFAGHVFTAPSVTIYLSTIMAYFYVQNQQSTEIEPFSKS